MLLIVEHTIEDSSTFYQWHSFLYLKRRPLEAFVLLTLFNIIAVIITSLGMLSSHTVGYGACRLMAAL